MFRARKCELGRSAFRGSAMLARAEIALGETDIQLRAAAAVDRLDDVASRMERKWGIGRLRLLVEPDLCLRFDRQARKLEAAIAADDAAAILVQAEGMARAWKALDAAATAGGAEPLSPAVWEMKLPASGEVVSLVRTEAEARAVAGECWTLPEVAVLLERLGPEARAVYPGARLVALRDRLTERGLDDELPPAVSGKPATALTGSRPLRTWTDDRGWIADIGRAEPGDPKLALLFEWVVAAGGWIAGGTAELPALPAGLARVELCRLLRQHGIEPRLAAPAGVAPDGARHRVRTESEAKRAARLAAEAAARHGVAEDDDLNDEIPF
jgi:hypothetical protein